MSTAMTIPLIAYFFALSVVYAAGKQWSVSLYWIGAAVVTISVLWMSVQAEISK